MTERSATLVAISSEKAEGAQETIGQYQLTFPLLTDEHNAVAKRYGLVFALDPVARRFHLDIGVNLEERHAGGDWKLPIPGTYAIAPNGRIIWSFVNNNYIERAEPSDIIAALDTYLTDKTYDDLQARDT